MPMWTCDFADCTQPAVRNLGDCVLCKRHLCATHIQPSFHQCPKWADEDKYDPAARVAEADELQQLITKINTTELETRASHLRGGIPCSIPPLQHNHVKRSSVMGGMNYHVEICFDDGVKWIARVRRFNTTSPPPALRDYIFQSEVATLKFLESINFPAPRVFDFALEGPSNPVGVGYILMEKLKGTSLRWSLATLEQKNRLMTDLANIFVQLSKYPFGLLGSLDCPADPSRVGPFARESLTDFTAASKMRTIGPLSSWEQYHRSLLKLIMDLIIRGEMYSQRPVDAYLIHRFLLDLIPTVLSSASALDDDGGHPRFFLKHADDKGDHIMVDEDFNITGIIDWEWAHTAPPSHAFNSPIGLLPVGDFYDGKNDLGDDEVVFARLLEDKNADGRNGDGVDLAGCVRQGRLQHRFAFCSGYDLEDWDGFLGLFRGLREAVKVDDGLDWDEWKMTALRRYKDDTNLQQLLLQVNTLTG